MIVLKNGFFRLDTANTSYIFRITRHKHSEHVHYGVRIQDDALEALLYKRNAVFGSCVVPDAEDPTYSLDTIPLEWSGIGRGDYRETPAEIRMPDGGFTCDFCYEEHEIVSGVSEPKDLPSAYAGNPDDPDVETLVLHLSDQATGVRLHLYYTVFPASDVITRRCVLENCADKPLEIRRLMSFCLDMPNEDYTLSTFDGDWIHEAHRHDRPLQYGSFINASTTGSSSNRHNPGFLLAKPHTGEDTGEAYGFNLIYSGNHYGCVELSQHDLVRVMLGINPHCFSWTLLPCESFESPQAVLSFSAQGLNGLSAHFSDFVNRHIVRGDWKGRERPVLFNSWEACFFNFSQGKLLRLARKAKKLGIELFVLDDGWFKGRDSDHAGLGDYTVNRRKLPSGMKGFSRKIVRMGLQFGLWFEPEMVNPDSDLYRAHPEYAVQRPNSRPALGRNQLVLDLCNPIVRDYIVENISRLLDSCPITYVKWDMNRHLSDMYSPVLTNQGEFYHRYILGLYDILRRVFIPRPHILLESCSSGGNRFDLGMLCFSAQIWASDNTDPIARLDIQQGLSYLYPLSAIGAHVSMAPHSQTLRNTPLSTRFHVAAFGCLGFELNLTQLSREERREIQEQITYYKAYRRLFQYGRFRRADMRADRRMRQWECRSEDNGAIAVGQFHLLMPVSPSPEMLRVEGLNAADVYHVSTKTQRVFIGRFGGLIRHLIPLKLKYDSFIMRWANRLFSLADCAESYLCSGATLSVGIRLHDLYQGTGYGKDIRMGTDFASCLYRLDRMESRTQPKEVAK